MLKKFRGELEVKDLSHVFEKLDNIAKTIKDEGAVSTELNIAISALSSDIINSSLKFLYDKLTIVEIARVAEACHSHIRLGKLMQKYIDKEGGE